MFGTSPGLQYAGTTSNLNFGGIGMNPLLLTGLISGGSSLLQGLLGGLGKKQEAKDQYAMWEKMRNRQMSDINQYLKPQQAYYQTPYLPGVDRVLAQAVLGNIGSRVGGDTLGQWGIDIEDIFSTMGLDQPFSQSQQAGYYGGNIPRSPYLAKSFGLGGGALRPSMLSEPARPISMGAKYDQRKRAI